nr:aldo/keto reductase [Streptomyces sp. SID3915]
MLGCHEAILTPAPSRHARRGGPCHTPAGHSPARLALPVSGTRGQAGTCRRDVSARHGGWDAPPSCGYRRCTSPAARRPTGAGNDERRQAVEHTEVDDIANEVRAVATDAGATPARVAPAWLLAQGEDIAPVPGTGRVHRVEEDTAAAEVRLTPEQLDRLPGPSPAVGETHPEGAPAMLEH